MGSRRLAKISLAVAIVVLVVSLTGFVITLVLNIFVLDRYKAYGEVPVPGTASLDLPAGAVAVSLHTTVIGGTHGVGLPVPPLGIWINPPDGVTQPVVTESTGSTTTINNEAHVRVWMVQVPADATYEITTDGQVDGFINPRLAFGYRSSSGHLVWVFVAMSVVGLIDVALSVLWMARARRTVAAQRYLAPRADRR
ncbi:SHOCT domain-containing protein [Mycobacterium spongiae]|uniref:SHOCT domain-containing protein n=1 Tax=Mycobacterium spongiae TaxID=886343 RepID=UPI001FEBAFE4|nr:SHOCT domain-containing protein [Mycobacterium spongiae]